VLARLSAKEELHAKHEWQAANLGTVLVLACCFTSAALTQDSQPAAVLFENVRVFDGKSAQLSGPTNVIACGNKIEKISTAPIPVDRRRCNQFVFMNE
jgi:hypothetical protein